MARRGGPRRMPTPQVDMEHLLDALKQEVKGGFPIAGLPNHHWIRKNRSRICTPLQAFLWSMVSKLLIWQLRVASALDTGLCPGTVGISITNSGPCGLALCSSAACLRNLQPPGLRFLQETPAAGRLVVRFLALGRIFVNLWVAMCPAYYGQQTLHAAFMYVWSFVVKFRYVFAGFLMLIPFPFHPKHVHEAGPFDASSCGSHASCPLDFFLSSFWPLLSSFCPLGLFLSSSCPLLGFLVILVSSSYNFSISGSQLFTLPTLAMLLRFNPNIPKHDL